MLLDESMCSVSVTALFSLGVRLRLLVGTSSSYPIALRIPMQSVTSLVFQGLANPFKASHLYSGFPLSCCLNRECASSAAEGLSQLKSHETHS